LPNGVLSPNPPPPPPPHTHHTQIFATGNEYLERCNGTPAFLAPEMMKPNTRYRWGGAQAQLQAQQAQTARDVSLSSA
jgi:hypothetical protein